MVFVAGPRQVGKTTLAKQILEASGPGLYLSWDQKQDRRGIYRAQWPADEALIVLDELHKYRLWKRWLKGEYDKHRDRLRFLVTGSARLDLYRRGGDSLQGRYHHYRLHPFSVAEVGNGGKDRPVASPGQELDFASGQGAGDVLEALLRFGGFPEPFLAQSDRTLRRWQKERVDRFFREDVRDLENVQDLSSMQILADFLPERVASPLEDLEVSYRAASRWMDILDRLYFVFRVRPYDARAVRALKKMPKAYLWDSSLVPKPGARFENLVALHLLKFCHYLEDTEGYRIDLHYLRDAMGREVDFLVTVDKKPWFAVEAKVSGDEIDASLQYFRTRLKIPFAYQVVQDGRRDFVEEGVRCLPAWKFLRALA
jgi:predicted AAA+ superfamily ATPase